MQFLELLLKVADSVYQFGGLFTLMEWTLVAGFAAMAVANPHIGRRFFEGVERRGVAFAANRTRQLIAVGLLAIAARAAFLPWLGVPSPLVHDEQSILLQGQTFAAGRLASPPHPMWEHFETYYVNQIPAYASMYFPGRSAPVAAGLLVAGNAWAGVWMSMVLLCVAATWMLQGWVALPFALLGGVLVVLRLGITSFWVNSFYGGAFTALGAMLVMGALPRILRGPRWRHSVALGLGAAILMMTRPYEGALVCLPVAVVLVWRLIRPPATASRTALVTVMLPAALWVAAAGGLMIAHNVATTSDPFKTPYGLNRATYASAPAFLISAPVPSQARGPAHFQAYFAKEAEPYQRRSSPLQILRGIVGKLLYTWNFYVGATLTAAFAAGLWCCRRNYFLTGSLALFLAGYLLVTWNFPQYTAPLYPVLLILTMRGFERLRTLQWRGKKPVGLFATRAMPTVAIALLALPGILALMDPRALVNSSVQAICCKGSAQNPRHALNAQLNAIRGTDLVMVKNGPHNPVNFEMVYNEPAIDPSSVVWAHRIDPEKDHRLREYFSDRHVWEFEWMPETDEGYRLTLIGQPLDRSNRLPGLGSRP